MRAGLLRRLPPADRFAIELLLREALTNAIFHGASRPRTAEIVYEVRPIPGGVRIRVADGGVGFNWREWEEKPSPPAEEYGLGLTILHRYASRVRFLGNGNEVELIKLLPEGTTL